MKNYSSPKAVSSFSKGENVIVAGVMGSGAMSGCTKCKN